MAVAADAVPDAVSSTLASMLPSAARVAVNTRERTPSVKVSSTCVASDGPAVQVQPGIGADRADHEGVARRIDGDRAGDVDEVRLGARGGRRRRDGRDRGRRGAGRRHQVAGGGQRADLVVGGGVEDADVGAHGERAGDDHGGDAARRDQRGAAVREVASSWDGRYGRAPEADRQPLAKVWPTDVRSSIAAANIWGCGCWWSRTIRGSRSRCGRAWPGRATTSSWSPPAPTRSPPTPTDLVLLDLGLPDLDGQVVCRELRSRSSVPIIVVSARGEEIDRVMLLELGADDYVVKPFGFRELVARIRAVARRTTADAEPADRIDDRRRCADASTGGRGASSTAVTPSA